MYSLVGIDGNAFNIMGYVVKAMRGCDYSEQEIKDYLGQCLSSDSYSKLLVISLEVVNECNRRLANL